jgi:hypothetical protein
MSTCVQENVKVVRSGATAAKYADYHMWSMVILALSFGLNLLTKPVTFSCGLLGRTTDCKDTLHKLHQKLGHNSKTWRRTTVIWNMCWTVYLQTVSVRGVEHPLLPPWEWKIACHATGALRKSCGCVAMCSHVQNQIRPDLQVQNQKKKYLRVQNKIYTGKKKQNWSSTCVAMCIFFCKHMIKSCCVCVVKQCFREKRW